MRQRQQPDRHVHMSIAVRHDIYHGLHRLRLERGRGAAKLPPLCGLINEALEAYVEHAVVASADQDAPAKAQTAAPTSGADTFSESPPSMGDIEQ